MESVEESMADFEGFIFDEDFLVIDEAHELEDIAANQLGLRLPLQRQNYHMSRLDHHVFRNIDQCLSENYLCPKEYKSNY